MLSRKYCAHALCFALLASLGCAPRPSSVPLGVGPLALSEKDAEAQASVRTEARAASRSEPAPRESREAAASPSSEPDEPAAPSSSEGGGTEDPPEPAPSKSGSTSTFAGLYSGTDVASYRLPGFPDREDVDDKAKIRVEDAAPGAVLLTLVNSADGSDLCSLSARLEGSTAVLDPAQPCFESEGEGDSGVQGELTSGRAVFDGDELRMDAVGVVTVPFPDQELEGEITYSFKGRRR